MSNLDIEALHSRYCRTIGVEPNRLGITIEIPEAEYEEMMRLAAAASSFVGEARPSRQVDLLPEEIRADVAAVRGWMDRSNARHREHIVEEAGETWRTFGPVLDGT